jgi:hypothetical protein
VSNNLSYENDVRLVRCSGMAAQRQA